ncbi:hypothetical protein HME9302_00169 [Alteripontixanthobacter maritimus]|uniref:Zinc finger CHCC-type domain-containing protein n=1 Tax=Alteripontixanthobacter maritimus TaxID=2161824 RepID=A0A369Q399_9SPHN|nr:zinc-finger domain-containing protein [Alteripontixanthobacter maritimus]RDC58992.1 hypothetical protein HME9302_00169 [Alteripontixanthobacter maritimus]
MRTTYTPPPEVITVTTPRVSCDGASGIRAPRQIPGQAPGKTPGAAVIGATALGHPRVFLEIDEHGYVDCGYCDRRFVLEGGPADGVDQATLRDISEGGDPGHR